MLRWCRHRAPQKRHTGIRLVPDFNIHADNLLEAGSSTKHGYSCEATNDARESSPAGTSKCNLSPIQSVSHYTVQRSHNYTTYKHYISCLLWGVCSIVPWSCVEMTVQQARAVLSSASLYFTANSAPAPTGYMRGMRSALWQYLRRIMALWSMHGWCRSAGWRAPRSGC